MTQSFLRIRPIDGCSSKDNNSVFFQLDDTRIECRAPVHSQQYKNSKSNLDRLKKRIFEFDKILDEKADQEQLYNDCVQPLLTKYFDGENVLLFAYGTTSSGKTFTMQGSPQNPGVIPRCISDIFQSVRSKLIAEPNFKRTRFNDSERLVDLRRERDIKSAILNSVDDKSFCMSNLKYRPEGFQSFLKDDPNIRHIVWVSFLELYNEIPIDLLVPSNDSNERAPQLRIMRDTKSNFFVSGLRQVYVNSAEEAMKVYLYGIDNLKKHVSSTAMNRTSSRSHSVFTLSVLTLKKQPRTSSNKPDDYTVIHVNNFSLCDLAGQERNKKTQTAGLHLKQAGAINKSLFQLRRCIQVIKEGKNSSCSQPVVPFSESALTKVFKPYLTGSGLTFMIININPKSEHFDETINSLEFSATASQIEIIKNESTQSLKDKLQRFTQNWLQTSKRWSAMQDLNSLNSRTNSAFIADLSSSQFKSTASSEVTLGDDIITDTQNILAKSKFDSTYFENSITQKVYDLEETIVEEEVELELYGADYVEHLEKKFDELAEKVEDADRNPQMRKTNLECINSSLVEICERHEEEKTKIKDRMNELMQNRMRNLQAQYEDQIQDLEKDNEALNLQLLCKESEVERYKGEAEKKSEQIAKLTEESRIANCEWEKRLLEKDEAHRKQLELLRQQLDEAHRKQLELLRQQFNDQLLKSENEKMEIETQHCVDHLVNQADYQTRLEELLSELRAREANKSRLSRTTSEDPQHSKLTDDGGDKPEASEKADSPTKPMSSHIEQDYSFGQFSLYDHHRNLLADINTKRSSLKRPLPFDEAGLQQESPTLFTTNLQPIQSDLSEAVHQQSKLHHIAGHPSIIETPEHRLSSTTTANLTDRPPPAMQNADQLLASIVDKNIESEQEEIKKQNEELKVLLDYKDKEIKDLRADLQKMNKEMSRQIKDEGISMMNSNHAKLTKTLYNSVVNHSQYVTSNTPYKPLSVLTSIRKKRNIEEESTQTSDTKYLDYIKNTEKSPTTEKKTKKKRTATERKRKVKDEIPEDRIVEENDDKEVAVDDLMFFVEGTTKKKGKKEKLKVSCDC